MKKRGCIRAEVTLHARGEHFLHGAGTGPDPESAIGAAADASSARPRSSKASGSGRRRRLPARARAGRGRGAADPTTAGAAHHPRPPLCREADVDRRSGAEVGDGTDAVIVFRNAATRHHHRPVPAAGRASRIDRARSRDRSSQIVSVEHTSIPSLTVERLLPEPVRCHRPPARTAERPGRPRSADLQPAHPEDRSGARRLPRVPAARPRPRLRRERGPVSRRSRSRGTADDARRDVLARRFPAC